MIFNLHVHDHYKIFLNLYFLKCFANSWNWSAFKTHVLFFKTHGSSFLFPLSQLPSLSFLPFPSLPFSSLCDTDNEAQWAPSYTSQLFLFYSFLGGRFKCVYFSSNVLFQAINKNTDLCRKQEQTSTFTCRLTNFVSY